MLDNFDIYKKYFNSQRTTLIFLFRLNILQLRYIYNIYLHMFLTRQYPLHPMLKKRRRKHQWQNALCILTYFCLTLFLDTCISINKCMIFHCLYKDLELKIFFFKVTFIILICICCWKKRILRYKKIYMITDLPQNSIFLKVFQGY